MATMLYAMEIPSRGGNTLFANMYRAYETLPLEIKHRLIGRSAWNVYDYAANPTKRGSVGNDAPRFAHPVVRTHPATKRQALYVNRLMTESIEGLARAQSEALLALLFDHSEQPHARTDFDASERRKLRRVAVLGDVAA